MRPTDNASYQSVSGTGQTPQKVPQKPEEQP